MRKEKISSIGSDKNKAARYVVGGLIIAVVFGTVVGISRSLALNATSWGTYQTLVNDEAYNQGLIGYEEQQLRAKEIAYWQQWMISQPIIIITLAMIGVNIGLVLLTIGFVGFALNDSLDERTRRASLVLAAIVMFVLMFTSFFSTIQITIT